MIKLLLTGIWGILLLSGSVYFFASANSSSGPADQEEETAYFGKLETVLLDTMSVAVIRKNSVQGYIILDVAFTVDAKKNKQLTVPINLIIQNSVNNSFLANKKLNINRLDRFDADSYEEELVEIINEKIGEKIVAEVMIQRIDFLSSEEVRDNKLRGG